MIPCSEWKRTKFPHLLIRKERDFGLLMRNVSEFLVSNLEILVANVNVSFLASSDGVGLLVNRRELPGFELAICRQLI